MLHSIINYPHFRSCLY